LEHSGTGARSTLMYSSPLMTIHVLSGIAGLLSGTAAMLVRKGSPRHAMVGHIFFISMVILGATGAYIGVEHGDMANSVGGVFTMYLVTTAWTTAQRPNASGLWPPVRDARHARVETGSTYQQPATGHRLLSTLDWLGLAVVLIGATSLLYSGYQIWQLPGHKYRGVPALMIFFLGTVAALCAAGDVRMLARGISGRARIARHLWRMCFALFIASGSFFMGRIRIFPQFIRDAYIPILLTVLPLLLLVIWLVRLRMKNNPVRAFTGTG
jgi:uncharacterized membrane protein